MGVMLDEIPWGEPLLPPVHDPDWEKQLRGQSPPLAPIDLLVAPLPWLRQWVYAFPRSSFSGWDASHKAMIAVVVSQENACRHCYGANRALLKILGYSETFIGGIEHDLRMAELDDKERALFALCRNLARSRPRPSRTECDALVRLGYTRPMVADAAYAIAGVCMFNRVATLACSPLQEEIEQASKGSVDGIKGIAAMIVQALAARWKSDQQLAPLAPPVLLAGPFGPVVALLAELPASSRQLKAALDGAFAASRLSSVAKALMFAVVARALECQITERLARDLLQREGMTDAETDQALATLQSPRLAPRAAGLLVWTRETVNYQTPDIQQKTRALAKALGDDGVLLEAIGIAALANGVVRLAMLQE